MLNVKRTLLAATAMMAATLPGRAAEAGVETNGLRMTVLQEVVATSNALERPFQVSDTVLHLRGTLEAERQTDWGTVGLSASAETFEYRDFDFESDRFASLRLTFARSFGDDAGVNASMGYGFKDEGDDLLIGPVIIGTRTASHRIDGAMEGFLRLSEDLVLTAGIANAYERVGKSRFTVPLPALRLSPHRNTATAVLGLARDLDGHVVSLSADAALVTIHGEAPPASGLPSRRFGLAAGLETSLRGGIQIGIEAGAAVMQDDFDLARGVYPTYQVAAAKLWETGTRLKLALRGAVETDDTDDPLGSYIHRGELELSHPLHEDWTASAGVFAEWRENIAIGNEEEAEGFYLALAYDPTTRSSFLLRLDYDRRYRSLIETREETLEGKLGMRVKI